MATWLNEHDVEDVLRHHGKHELLGPAVRTLTNLVVWTNQNSDGWAYWNAPSKAAQKLQELIQRVHRDWLHKGDSVYAALTPEAIAAALRPIKSFRTKQVNLGRPSFEIVEIGKPRIGTKRVNVRLVINVDLETWTEAYGVAPEDLDNDITEHITRVTRDVVEQQLEALASGAELAV